MSDTKIDFALEVQDGFPPIHVERLNARMASPGQYEILNSPLFVKETAYGDIVAADATPEGRLVFKECLTPSTFKAISIILLDPVLDTALMDLFRHQETVIEYGEFGTLRMVGVGIPSTVDYDRIKAELDKYERLGKLSYAELVV